MTGVSTFITDPCTPEQLTLGTQYRAANCKATLAAVGATISDALQTPNNITGSASGNPDLSAETATTWTAGVVLRPRFVHGLTASLDWYDITLAGAINTPDASTLASLCVGSAQPGQRLLQVGDACAGNRRRQRLHGRARERGAVPHRRSRPQHRLPDPYSPILAHSTYG